MRHYQIFATNLQKPHDSVLLVEGNHVINGAWDLEPTQDQKVLRNPHSGTNYHFVCDVPKEIAQKGDYNEIIYECIGSKSQIFSPFDRQVSAAIRLLQKDTPNPVDVGEVKLRLLKKDATFEEGEFTLTALESGIFQAFSKNTSEELHWMKVSEISQAENYVTHLLETYPPRMREFQYVGHVGRLGLLQEKKPDRSLQKAPNAPSFPSLG
jgi:hypothetical protein